MGTADDRVYYVISDLHIGGDEQLEEVPFLDELLEFLSDLRDRDENIELVINGDAFGLWELTGIVGPEKFDVLLDNYPKLFDEFRRTGEEIKITLLPGNHDHELAAYGEYEDLFDQYNVDLVPDQSLQRSVGEHVIHFEHGHQHDQNNRITAWGDPHATPLGYYYNTLITSRAGQLSDRGRYNWLKDVQAVTPTERLPVWLFSKYFYREMHPALRYALVPFLLLFNISAVIAVLTGLDLVGFWSLPISKVPIFLGQFGTAGRVAWWLLSVNIVVAGILVLIGIPLYFIRRDLRQTFNRFGVFETRLTVDPEAPYVDAAASVFREDPDTVVFCYGHTHRPGLTRVGDGVIVNSGTWLKRLHRRDGVIGLLPPVFYPSYRLGAVRISREGEQLAVAFEDIHKPSPKREELTRTERFLTLGREPNPSYPDRVTVPDAGAE